MTEGGYRAYESGRSSPSLEDVPLLSSAMGMTVSEMLRELDLLGEEPAPQTVRLDADTIERIGEAVARRPVELAPEAVERIADELTHAVAPATAEAVVRRLREERPRFGSPEYIHQKTMEMTARLAQAFPDLPQEEIDFIWQQVEERRRLREREEKAEEPERNRSK